MEFLDYQDSDARGKMIFLIESAYTFSVVDLLMNEIELAVTANANFKIDRYQYK